MSEVNKLDNKQCPFDLEQFKVKVKSIEYEPIEPKIKSVEYESIEPKVKSVEFNDIVGAPVGTFPWAIIQVYLNIPVRLSSWEFGLYLLPKYDNSKNILYIQRLDKEGNSVIWEPLPEEMLACDWELAPTCTLSFDLKIGTDQFDGDQYQNWGYMTKDGDLGDGESTFGVLTNLQDTIGVGSILTFVLIEDPIGSSGEILFKVDTQNQPNLGSKNLEVAVNGSTYNLGTNSGTTIDFQYSSDGAKQLGELLKQNVGNTLHFWFNWK